MSENHIVWHDLMTGDVGKAERFYETLLGWRYNVEHATEFAWGNGEADYPLIVAENMAHGGMIEITADQPAYWLPYFEVGDVKAVTQKAERLGATIERDPFDVPGVGRNAVIRDPQGALFCVHTPSHNFPPPHGVFLWDQLFAPDIKQTVAFYQELLGIIPPVTQSKDHNAQWIPIVGTDNMTETLSEAETIEGMLGYEADVPGIGHVEFLTDPTGAPIGLVFDRDEQKLPLGLTT